MVIIKDTKRTRVCVNSVKQGLRRDRHTTDRERESERQTDRQTETDRGRERQTDRHSQRERDSSRIVSLTQPTLLGY